MLSYLGEEAARVYALRDHVPVEAEDPGAPLPAVRAASSPWVSLRTLKIVGVVLPVIFVFFLEAVRWSVVEDDLTREGDPGELGGHAALALLMIACVVVFGSAMFYFIDRAQGQVVHQNQQLTALMAVSTAVREDLSVDQIIDQAVLSVLACGGADSASISVPGHDRRDGDRGRADGGPPLGDGGHVPGGAVVDIALTAGTSSVGTMRLQTRARPQRPDRLTSETLQTIGQQVAYAIQRAQLIGDLKRGRDEGHALYDVLLQISNQRPLTTTLQAVIRFARDRLGCDGGAVCLGEAASRILLVESLPGGRPLRGMGPVCITPDGACAEPPLAEVDGATVTLAVPVGAPGAAYGDLWVARTRERPFTERDRRFLVTLAELTAVALAGARMRENERQGAIVAERERIARELHDSLAQVLGVTHLRLQALRVSPSVRIDEAVAAEVGELAGICHEGYRDVREAILGLGQSSRPDRYLLDSLSAYLQAYTRQSGIETSLEADVDRDLVLLPRCEVQVIRIIQEALTNVRKHAGARSAVVRVTRADRSIVFGVEDDGRGFAPDTLPTGSDGFGFGLSSIRERALLIGASLTIDSAPGSGTRLLLGVPTALVQPCPTTEIAGSGSRTRGA